jgi:hypothetical protein
MVEKIFPKFLKKEKPPEVQAKKIVDAFQKELAINPNKWQVLRFLKEKLKNADPKVAELVGKEVREVLRGKIEGWELKIKQGSLPPEETKEICDMVEYFGNYLRRGDMPPTVSQAPEIKLAARERLIQLFSHIFTNFDPEMAFSIFGKIFRNFLKLGMVDAETRERLRDSALNMLREVVEKYGTWVNEEEEIHWPVSIPELIKAFSLVGIVSQEDGIAWAKECMKETVIKILQARLPRSVDDFLEVIKKTGIFPLEELEQFLKSDKVKETAIEGLMRDVRLASGWFLLKDLETFLRLGIFTKEEIKTKPELEKVREFMHSEKVKKSAMEKLIDIIPVGPFLFFQRLNMYLEFGILSPEEVRTNPSLKEVLNERLQREKKRENSKDLKWLEEIQEWLEGKT